MGDLLSIGASGVRAYQSALTTVSENIANAGTASYVRRSAKMGEITSGTGWSSGFNGMGVEVSAINRAGNAYLDTSVRSASADLSRTEAGTVWLERIESSLGSGALAKRMTAFFTAGTALQADPTSTALRASMLSAGDSVADSFAVTAKSLDDAMAELDSRGAQTSSDLSRINAALLKVNEGLASTRQGTSAAAGLQDQRDQLLEQMSELTDVNVQLDDVGRATVRASGPGGPVLVNARDAATVNFTRSGGNVGLVVSGVGNGLAVMEPDGGTLAGITEGAQRIASAREQLGTIATDFTSMMNDLQSQGQDVKGVKGTDFFQKNSADPTDFSVKLASGDLIAASGGAGPRDATNLAKLATLRVSDGYESRVQGLVTDNAATLKQRRLVADAQGAIKDGAVTARSEAAGVNMDSEAIDLVRFQQAYQASSRVIQVARETFQSILEIR